MQGRQGRQAWLRHFAAWAALLMGVDMDGDVHRAFVPCLPFTHTFIFLAFLLSTPALGSGTILTCLHLLRLLPCLPACLLSGTGGWMDFCLVVTSTTHLHTTRLYYLQSCTGLSLPLFSHHIFSSPRTSLLLCPTHTPCLPSLPMPPHALPFPHFCMPCMPSCLYSFTLPAPPSYMMGRRFWLDSQILRLDTACVT